MLGYPFAQHITSGGTTLSDNSFLMLLGSFGLVVALSYFICVAGGLVINREDKPIAALMVMLLLFMGLSDFVSLYPSSYLMTILILGITRGTDKDYKNEFTCHHS